MYFIVNIYFTDGYISFAVYMNECMNASMGWLHLVTQDLQEYCCKEYESDLEQVRKGKLKFSLTYIPLADISKRQGGARATEEAEKVKSSLLLITLLNSDCT